MLDNRVIYCDKKTDELLYELAPPSNDLHSAAPILSLAAFNANLPAITI